MDDEACMWLGVPWAVLLGLALLGIPDYVYITTGLCAEVLVIELLRVRYGLR